MKKVLLPVALAALAVLSGCAVVPAYGPAYQEPAPYYGSRSYYGPPTVIVPAPVFVPRWGPPHRGHRYGDRGRHWR